MSSTTTTTPYVSSYRRIIAAGHDLRVTHQRHAYRLKLMKGEEVVAFVDCSRTGNLSALGALEKARLNTFGPTSGFFKSLQQLADIAEANAAAGV